MKLVAFMPLIYVVASTLVFAQQRAVIVVDAKVTVPVEKAIDDLRRALELNRCEVFQADAISDDEKLSFVIGVAGKSATVDRLLESHKISLPRQGESLSVAKVPTKSGQTILIAGRDARGLSYAMMDVANSIKLTPADSSWLDSIQTTIEKPYLRHRSVTIHLSNRELEEEWYFDEAFWREYFAMLARNRFNNFTLTFADQMNYLNPVYAHLVDVPGFDSVQASDATPDGKRRNLKMLRRITELADERALDFTFGVWTQQPVENFGGEITVKNVPKGKKFMEYCAGGLTQVLKACSSIDAVQFRMNAESGIDEDEQANYYQSQFDAIRNCGRKVRLELRYKGLRSETIKQAISSGLDLTVSTKFWCEHLGLPYHPTAEDTHYRESRYGYGAMLAKPRDYRVIYRLWTVGSHRLLLWADPNYAARFAQSCRLGDGEGFEIFAPLTNKGYENAAGKWRIFADRSFESFRWEQQRYWFYYLVFGRMGYNPKCDPDVWRRELKQRFGNAAADVETAYRNASQILPLITATRMPSASEWRWWPEMDTGGPLEEYMHTSPSDTAQFYGIRTWRRTENWWRETWDEFPAGFVEDAVRGKVSARWTPIQVSQRLTQLANATLSALENADAKFKDKSSPEVRAVRLDMRIHANLARYHAEKTRAATHLGFFNVTRETNRLPLALRHMTKAEAAWSRIVELTDGVYHNDLVFGHRKGSKRSRAGHHHSGHWKDRLSEVTADVDYLRSLIKKNPPNITSFVLHRGESPPKHMPRVEHTPITSTQSGKPLTIRAQVTCATPVKLVRLYFRPLNQTVDWKQTRMRALEIGGFAATISSEQIDDRYDFMYYIEALVDGGGTLWPSWQNQQPYVVVKVTGDGQESK